MRKITNAFVVLLSLFFLIACDGDTDSKSVRAEVQTLSAIEVTDITAVCKGKIVNAQASTISQYGIELNDGKGYKKHPSTNISSNNEFEVSFTGLTSGHGYNYRAYIDDGAVSYGVEKKFTTLPLASYTATINPTTIENHSVAISFTLTDRLKEWGVYYSA